MSGNFTKYKQQKCKCLSILKETKTNYFNNLNPKVIADNKKLWSAVKPFAIDVLNPLMRKNLIIN